MSTCHKTHWEGGDDNINPPQRCKPKIQFQKHTLNPSCTEFLNHSEVNVVWLTVEPSPAGLLPLHHKARQNCAVFSLNVSGLPPVSPRTQEFKISALYLTRPHNQILPHIEDTVLPGEAAPRKLTYGAGWGLFVALAYWSKDNCGLWAHWAIIHQ